MPLPAGVGFVDAGLIHAYVVNLHGARKHRIRAHRARPIPPSGNIEYEVEVLIKGRWVRIPGRIPLVLNGILYAVYVPTDLLLLPLDGVDVEVVPRRAGGLSVGSRVDVVRPARTVVQRPVHSVVARSEVCGLDDVDLSAPCPGPIDRITRQHPNRRPQTLSVGQFRLDIDPPVPPGGTVSGGQACGRMALRDDRTVVVWSSHRTGRTIGQHNDMKHPVPNEHVPLVANVALVFVVTASPAVHVVLPLSLVQFGAVELIGPRQVPQSSGAHPWAGGFPTLAAGCDES